jgi:hypothetical protein
MTPSTNTLKVTSTGIVAPTPTVSYQWMRGSSPISGATASSYKLTSSDSKRRSGFGLSSPKRPTRPWSRRPAGGLHHRAGLHSNHGTDTRVAGRRYCGGRRAELVSYDGVVSSPALTYQWKRKRYIHPPARRHRPTRSRPRLRHPPQCADHCESAGHLSFTYTVAASPVIAKGVTTSLRWSRSNLARALAR